MGHDLGWNALASEVGVWGFGHDNPNIKLIPTTRLKRRHLGDSTPRYTAAPQRRGANSMK